MCSQYKIKLAQAKFLNALFSWGTAEWYFFTGVAPCKITMCPPSGNRGVCRLLRVVTITRAKQCSSLLHCTLRTICYPIKFGLHINFYRLTCEQETGLLIMLMLLHASRAVEKLPNMRRLISAWAYTQLEQIHITQTRLCNILRYFTAVKMIIFR